MDDKVTRRQFVRDSAAAAAAFVYGSSAAEKALAAKGSKKSTGKPLNYNPDMEYRRCGRTNLMISAVALGGHWKRVTNIIGGEKFKGWMLFDIDRPGLLENRSDVVSRCIDRGINYIDACCKEEILVYSKALKGRRDKMYLGYSWHKKESRFEEWRSSKKLQQGFDEGMKEAGLDYVDLWRITMLVESSQHSEAEIEAAVTALDWAKKTGRARFTGISSHDRPSLKQIIEKYNKQMDVILTPYTAKTKMVTDESGLWATLKKYDVGWFGIKPFASNSIFKGDSTPGNPHFEEDNRLARLAIRYILCNSAITAPIPGLITIEQVDNMALAIKERRELDVKEKADLEQAMNHAWDNLPSNYQWLKDWEYV